MSLEPFSNPEWMTTVVSLLYVVDFAILMPIVIAMYIVQALSLMRIAKKLDVEKGWMAFVPFANLVLIGKLAEKSDERAYPGQTGKKWSKILLGWAIVTIAAVLVLTVLLTVGLVFAGLSLPNDKMIAVTVVSSIVYTLILLIPAIILEVYEYMAFYRIYRVMAGQKNAVWMLLLTIFVNPAATVILAVLGFSPKSPVAEEESVNHFEYGV